MQIRQEKGCYTLYKENEAIGTAVVDGTTILRLEVVPRWRGRGYGSYLLKELLRQNGGLDPKQATRFTAPLPRDAAGRALAQKYGFVPDGGQMVRRRVPDLSAVQLCHAFLTARLAPGGLYVDATCGNGHDTQFLCTLAGPAGRVLGLDIQQQAVDNTNARLAAAGYGAVGRAVLHDHARLAELVQPGTADCVLFNFGWLPGAEHDVHSTADGSVPALRAALEALRPGGVLAAVGAAAYVLWAGPADGVQWALLVVAVLGAGAVPAACGALLGKKPESLMAMAGGSLACAFVGAVSYRCIMWLITVPIANLFLNVL